MKLIVGYLVAVQLLLGAALSFLVPEDAAEQRALFAALQLPVALHSTLWWGVGVGILGGTATCAGLRSASWVRNIAPFILSDVFPHHYDLQSHHGTASRTHTHNHTPSPAHNQSCLPDSPIPRPSHRSLPFTLIDVLSPYL
jgi:hypothetical protein